MLTDHYKDPCSPLYVDKGSSVLIPGPGDVPITINGKLMSMPMDFNVLFFIEYLSKGTLAIIDAPLGKGTGFYNLEALKNTVYYLTEKGVCRADVKTAYCDLHDIQSIASAADNFGRKFDIVSDHLTCLDWVFINDGLGEQGFIEKIPMITDDLFRFLNPDGKLFLSYSRLDHIVGKDLLVKKALAGKYCLSEVIIDDVYELSGRMMDCFGGHFETYQITGSNYIRAVYEATGIFVISRMI